MKITLSAFVTVFLTSSVFAAGETHDLAFWRSIRNHDFAVPSGYSAAQLASEIVDLAGETDPALRDECGYEILAAWVYQKNLLTADELEMVRQKLLTGMTFHIGGSDDPTIFRRSFSALYMSILAAHDLRKPFLTPAAFKETLETALKCYATEKDLRGYSPQTGWAHATAHVADLLKFLGRNPQVSAKDQRQIIDAVVQRCRTVPSVFVWGEDARIAAALLSIINRKDFDPTIFDEWLKAVTGENKQLWSAPKLDTLAYVHVRTEANVLTQLAAKVASKNGDDIPAPFRTALNTSVAELN